MNAFKKIISLCLCMALGTAFIPTKVFAEEGDLVEESQDTVEQTDDLVYSEESEGDDDAQKDSFELESIQMEPSVYSEVDGVNHNELVTNYIQTQGDEEPQGEETLLQGKYDDGELTTSYYPASELDIYVEGTYNYDYAIQVLNIVNQKRAEHGASALAMDADLLAGAQLRAMEIAVYFSHTRPNGNDCFSVSEFNGKCFAENIAAGQTTPTAVMNSWMDSAGHQANILNSSYRSIGIGCVEVNGVKYWVQNFGSATATATSQSGSETLTKRINIIPDKATLSFASTSLKTGETKQLVVRAYNSFSYAYLEPESFNFSSSNNNVISVDANGNVTGKAAGSATITASHKMDSTCKATTTIEVTEDTKPVTSISLDRTSLDLSVGNTATLTATVLPTDATDKTVTWSSSNTSIATVNRSGLVTAVGSGTATVTASTSNGKSATCTVRVAASTHTVYYSANGGSGGPSSFTKTNGTAVTLSTSKPTKFPHDFLGWSGSSTARSASYLPGDSFNDDSITTLYAVWRTTSIKTMPFTEEADIHIPGMTHYIGITVSEPGTYVISSTGDCDTFGELYQEDETKLVENDDDGENYNFSITYAFDSGTTYYLKTRLYSSSDTGTFTVHATRVAEAESVTLNRSELNLSVGDTATLTATVLPEDAVDKTITWSSSDTSVATVNGSGLVTAVGSGTASITASTSNGKSATCTVRVAASTHTVYYSANGGSGGPSSFTKTDGTAVTLSTTIPTKFPQDFLGWSDSSTASSADYLPGDSFNDDSITTLYAVWRTTSIKTMPFTEEADIYIPGMTHYIGITVSEPGTYVISSSGDCDTIGELYRENGTNLAVDDDGGENRNFLITYTFDSASTYYLKTKLYSSSRTGTFTVHAERVAEAESVTLNKSSLELLVGDTATLTATVLPEDAVDKAITWSSSNPSVATVDGSGLVTAVSSGTASITASTNNSKSATCTVRVSAPTQLKITRQPTDQYANVGAKTSVTVTAQGDGLTYQWYLKNPGSSRFGKSSITSNTYSVTMSDSIDGRQVYCVVSDRYGGSVTTNTATLFKRISLSITSQPQNSYTAIGEKAKATVVASGNGITYQWYVKNKAGTKFSKSSITSNTYSVVMSDSVNGRQVYCVVTDRYGSTVTSKTVTLHKYVPVSIATQPRDCYVANGEKATATVVANGSGLKYQWYLKNKSSATFSKSSITTNAYSVTMSDNIDGRKVYCVITDAKGKSVTSNTVSLNKYIALSITSQPKNCTVANGEIATTTVKATGTGLKYQWYLKNKTSTMFSKSSITSNTYSVTMSDAVDGRQVYCVVTDRSGSTVTSKTATLHKYVPVSIATQPRDCYVANGEKATATVVANGSGLKYQWYLKNKSSATFSKSSITTNAYSVTMSDNIDGRKVYCVITDAKGKSVTSNTVSLNKYVALSITSQPKNCTVANGEIATATVKATGTGLKYQWYLKNKTATVFSKSSITKSTYSVTMSDSVNGRQVYCVVTDQGGNSVASNTVMLSQSPALSIISQPKDCYVYNDEKASVKVVAAGNGLKYQWYLKNKNSTKFSMSSITSNTYSVTMSDAVDGRQVYCIVTDQKGNIVISKTVTLNKYIPVSIESLPQNVKVANGAKASTTVKARGSGLTYQWYVKNKNASSFTKSSITKSTYSVTMSDSVNGRQLYCVIKDAKGVTIQTNVVTLSKK